MATFGLDTFRYLKTELPQSNSTRPIRLLYLQQPSKEIHIQSQILFRFLAKSNNDTQVIFRPHPNHANFVNIVLVGYVCPSSSYSIDDGKSSLYNLMLSCTHHMTAFSSCCYEASEFGIPILHYGPTSSLCTRMRYRPMCLVGLPVILRL